MATTRKAKPWRVGTRITPNVYEGDRPVCQCHNPEDAQRIVRAVNLAQGHLRELAVLSDNDSGLSDLNEYLTRVYALFSEIVPAMRKSHDSGSMHFSIFSTNQVAEAEDLWRLLQ